MWGLGSKVIGLNKIKQSMTIDDADQSVPLLVHYKYYVAMRII